jgi:8-oxo-dGTP pyrophosphatase MutT (NUDIX family)
MRPLQSAAIPYRRNPARELEVLLVTSRKKGRWVLPKGNVRGMLPHASAAREAFEEAGVIGIISRNSVGVYHHRKTVSADEEIVIPVNVFPLFVNTLLRTWPEMAYRSRRWMHVLEAAETVEDQEIRDVLHSFAEGYWQCDPAK